MIARPDGGGGPRGEGQGRDPSMHGHGKSDSPVVPAKLSNNAAAVAAEMVEERGLAEGNTAGKTCPGLRAGVSMSSALDRVRRVAQQDRKAQFTALLHHVTVDRLRAAYEALSRDAAAGVDGVTWQSYGQQLEENLQDLHARLHRGAYRAKPSRRGYIAKADGRLRPLGIASLEDKILQRAVVEVLNSIYEVDFLGFSYGFRPGRRPHDALDALSIAITRGKVGWVLDADIRDCFTSLDQSWLLRFLGHRIADRRVLRLIQKWLGAGVIEDGAWTQSDEGTPQGASVSPLLANVYLHYVLDLWVQQWRSRNAHGEIYIVRWADDFIVCFQSRYDAKRFHAELRERFAKFGLELNPEKTRVIEFGRFAARDRKARGVGRPETFEFLGFTHICGKNKKGGYALKRITSKKRMTAKLREVKFALQRRYHRPIPEQGEWLASVVRGHMAYYAVPDNIDAVATFRNQAARHWYRSLRRRSQRTRLDWQQMRRLQDRWLPPARIMHPWPHVRFDVRTQGRSPVR